MLPVSGALQLQTDGANSGHRPCTYTVLQFTKRVRTSIFLFVHSSKMTGNITEH